MTREEAIIRMQDIGCYNPDVVDRAEWKDGKVTLRTSDGKSFEFTSDSRLDDYIKADDVKAVVIGQRFFSPEILSLELSEGFDFGSGKITVLTSKNCIVKAVSAMLNELRATGCGICTFCREGGYQLSGIVDAMTKPGADKKQLDLALEIAGAMTTSCNCPVGEDTALPVLTALDLFRSEFEAHCGKGKCPSGECPAFSTLYIDPYKCEGNGDCMDVCPEDAIEGKPGFISMLDEYECTKCGKCIEVCENGAIQFATGRLPKLPERLTKVGRFRK